MLPIIIPELQNKSIISVVLGDSYFGALTSSGKLLTWGDYLDGALGLGDPGDLPIGSPGGFASGEDKLQAQRYGDVHPPAVGIPSEVRFDHNSTGREKKKQCCLAVAAGGWQMCAVVVDLEEDEVPSKHPEKHPERPEEDEVLPKHPEQHPEMLEERRTWFSRRWLQLRNRG